MYLSRLLIETGDNPDRPRPGRTWLRNLYHVHQRLSMAFPFPDKKVADPHFLQPFAPEPDFVKEHFLFRIDNFHDDTPSAHILVLSGIRPDWDYCFQNAPGLLVDGIKPDVKEYEPQFYTGQELRYRIRINLVRKVRNKETRPDAEHKIREKTKVAYNRLRTVDVTWNLNGVPAEEHDTVVQRTIHDWFRHLGTRLYEDPHSKENMHRGFDPQTCEILHLGWVLAVKSEHAQLTPVLPFGNEKRMQRYRSALLEGVLTVTDAELFTKTVLTGIGPAKAFGFGLLSVLPLR